jgi:hypothetical protein
MLKARVANMMKMVIVWYKILKVTADFIRIG